MNRNFENQTGDTTLEKDKKIELKNKCDLLYSLENSLNIETKVDTFLNNIPTIKKFMDYKTIDQVYIYSSFVRRNLNTILLYVLKNNIDYDNIDEIINIMVILNLILKLQEYYIDFMYDRCNLKKLEVFDVKKCEDYERMISVQVKKLKL